MRSEKSQVQHVRLGVVVDVVVRTGVVLTDRCLLHALTEVCYLFPRRFNQHCCANIVYKELGHHVTVYDVFISDFQQKNETKLLKTRVLRTF